ncbi:anaerobic sulfatase maturase [Lacrimispora sp.]|uniref:anaerobic sulfatase maturase n=1 Tax=Lacrimispora sp. TaxID=2719234 RepID=UPI00345FD530
MPPINVLIKPASGNCNMRCDYCFYYDTMCKREQSSYGFMSLETLEKVIQKVLAYAKGSCTFAFQGGEPTLCGLDFFEKSILFQKRYNINHVKIQNALQTNGYHLNQEWAEFFVKNNFLIGVSLDGGPKIHNRYRKNTKGEETFFKVMKNVELFQKAGVEFNILSVVNGATAPAIRKTYEFYRKNHLNYLQFISCLDPMGEPPGSREYSLTPEAYGRFLTDLFDLWYEDLQLGRQPYIRHFENYIGILLGQFPESCDMQGICGKQYVVEADGSVYPCDFYVMDRYRLGNFCKNSVEEIDQVREQIGFIKESQQKETACLNCRYEALCRGGCKRTRQADQDHHQYFCQSYKMFFDACLPKMLEIAKRIS